MVTLKGKGDTILYKYGNNGANSCVKNERGELE